MILGDIGNIVPVSSRHDKKIQKFVIIDKSTIQNITQLSEVLLPPGAQVEGHSHKDIYEIFLMKDGLIRFGVEGKDIVLKQNNYLIVEPCESHSLHNDTDENAYFLLLGVEKG